MTQNIDPIRYDIWLEEALRGVVRRALEHTRDFGLGGDHHYYITFDTVHEGVMMPDHLRALHPNDMTVVLQHQYEDLEVDKDTVQVTLRFSGRPARLVIPFAAVTSFADPSVNFGLQLRVADDLDDDLDGLDALGAEDLDINDDIDGGDIGDAAEATGTEQGSAEVITLDAFRKK